MIRYLAAAIRDRKGSSAYEAAIIAPVLLALGVGAFEAFEVYRAHAKVVQASEAIAALVAAKSTITAADVADFCTGGKFVMAPYLVAPYATTTFKATVASIINTNGTFSADWQDHTCGGATALTSSDITSAGTLIPTSGNSVILVKVAYTYANPIHFVLSASYAMTGTSNLPPQSGSKVVCSTLPTPC